MLEISIIFEIKNARIISILLIKIVFLEFFFTFYDIVYDYLHASKIKKISIKKRIIKLQFY